MPRKKGPSLVKKASVLDVLLMEKDTTNLIDLSKRLNISPGDLALMLLKEDISKIPVRTRDWEGDESHINVSPDLKQRINGLVEYSKGNYIFGGQLSDDIGRTIGYKKALEEVGGRRKYHMSTLVWFDLKWIKEDNNHVNFTYISDAAKRQGRRRPEAFMFPRRKTIKRKAK